MSGFKNRAGLNVEALVDNGGKVIGIEFAHDAVHQDTFVTASEYVADLDIAVPRVYYIKPLEDFELHCVFNIQASAPCKVQIYEDPYATAEGTALLHMRHNRKSDILYSERETTFHTPTTTEDGTLILETYTGGSGTNPNNQIGGATRPGEEIVLNPAMPYRIVVTATADNTKMSFANEYYEVAV